MAGVDNQMAPFHICHGCKEIIRDGTPCHFVKVKGQRGLRWYCKECMKGGEKHGNTTGERH